MKTISAFANDIDNWGGGYIVIGAEEINGKLVRPMIGIDPTKIDGKILLLVWCPGGYERPYAFPKVPSSKKVKRYTIYGSYPVLLRLKIWM